LDYFEGRLQPFEYPEEEIRRSLERLKSELPWIDQLPYLKNL
jgi:tryptophan synthase beta chain